MVFCGKCGLQLNPGDTVCPRCGTPIEPDLNLEDFQPNSPTIASSSMYAPDQPQPGTASPGTPPQQQPLILRPDGNNYIPNEQSAAETTSMNSQVYSMPPQRMPYNPNAEPSYPGYMPQQGQSYAGYPGYVPQQIPYSQQSGATLAEAEKVRARGRIIGLLFILLGLLLILGAMVLFLVTHNNTTSASLPSHMLVQHYIMNLTLLQTTSGMAVPTHLPHLSSPNPPHSAA
jgi:hypothetical protein